MERASRPLFHPHRVKPTEPDFTRLATAARQAGGGGGRGRDKNHAAREAAFTALATPLRPRLVFTLRRECRNRAEAEDAVQATLLKLWQKLDRWDPRRPFMPWCITVAFRCLRDHQRKTKRLRLKPESAHREPADPTPGPADHAEVAEQADHLWALAESVLRPRAWTDLWLHYGEGLSPTEIATATGRRAGAVRVALHRAREKLAPHLTNPADTNAPPALTLVTP